VNGQKYDSLLTGKTAIVNWPVESAQAGATLGVSVADDFTQDIGFTGMWGLLRLLDIAHINKTSDAGFMAQWQVAVQNMYVVAVNCKVQVSASDHPFAEQVFRKFKCPVDLVAGSLSKDRPAAGVSLPQ
jgi:type VI protein secretion system component VasK